MKLRFSKMHGLGNDFVVLDGVSQDVVLTSEQLRYLGDRRLGVGCDQILLVEAADTPGVDFRYRIFNADGNEVEQCGNGARCLARFVRAQSLTDKRDLVVATNAGKIALSLAHDDATVSVDMGRPRLEPAEIPFQAERRAARYDLQVGAQRFEIGAVSMGNPHAVLRVADADRAPVAELGALIERHPRFPARVNVGFMQVVSPERIRLRVFERGVGETRACGSGACAAVVVGNLQHALSARVRVELTGGELEISWNRINIDDDKASVIMKGPAAHVFSGEIEL